MGLDIFFIEDIRNAILAADEASSATAAVAARVSDAKDLRAFLKGYRAALDTMALAFGLAPQARKHDDEERQEDGKDDILVRRDLHTGLSGVRATDVPVSFSVRELP